LTLSNVVRLADLFDALEPYGLHVRAIRPAGFLPGLGLMVFSLFIDFFVLQVMFGFPGRFRGWMAKHMEHEEWFTPGFFITAGLFLVIWLPGALLLRNWRPIDLLLWPLDNLLRIVDFLDLMEAMGWRLHRVPMVPLEATVTMVFRIVLGLVLGGFVARFVRNAMFQATGGRWQTVDDLEEIARTHDDLKCRAEAGRRLADLADARRRAVETTLWSRLASPPMLGALAGTGFAILVALLVAAAGREPTRVLVQAASEEPWVRADRALRVLESMGLSAEEAIPDVDKLARAAQPERRASYDRTLGRLEPKSGPFLGSFSLYPEEKTALAAVEALAELDYESAIPLADAWARSLHARVREKARAALAESGDAAISPLFDSLTEANLQERLPHLEELDPYLDLRRSEYALFQELAAERKWLRVLSDP
jgi:hypothetical protein